jgi:hypothetical protein
VKPLGSLLYYNGSTDDGSVVAAANIAIPSLLGVGMNRASVLMEFILLLLFT